MMVKVENGESVPEDAFFTKTASLGDEFAVWVG